MVDLIDQMANLGQLSGLLQTTTDLTGLLPPPDYSHVSGAANAVSGSISRALPDMKLPDMQQLMEMAGPLLELLSSQNRNDNK